MNYDGAKGLEFGVRNTAIDPAVAAVLPRRCTVVSIEHHGVSFWAKTGRLDVKLEDGTLESFFIKVTSKDTGKQMMHGEFESSLAIYRLLPDFIPKPIAWGSYRMVPDTHFFISKFREMTADLPSPPQFAARLAALHLDSKSPQGKFGFHLNNFMGNLSQNNEWEESWEKFFTKNMRHTLSLELAAQGPEPEFDTLVPVIFDKVIPRLLHPLETGGRSVKPSLVHGDLWFANTGVDVNTGEPMVFDACCFYAHNEYELGQWKPVCNRFGADYVEAYHSYVQVSAPEEDYDGRIDLYKLKFNAHVSALFPKDTNLRKQMLDDMRDLVQRYG